jgi:hypothetical protein
VSKNKTKQRRAHALNIMVSYHLFIRRDDPVPR